MKMVNKKGISLIVLIITIIVVIILAAVVILTLSKNNPINSAKEATFKEDIYNFKNELEVYKAKISRNGEDVTKLYANKDSDPSITDVITSITRKYIDRLEVREGKLVYVGKDKTEYILAKDMGLLPEDELLDDDILTELKPFITEWTVEAGDSITLPIRGTCNFTVDYGDGTGEYKVTSATDEDRIHTYEAAGTYTIKINGKCERIDFYNIYFSKDKITKIVQWGNLGVKVINFAQCSNLTGTIPDPQKNTFSNTNNMEYLFFNCKKVNGSIPENLFKNASKLNSLADAFRYSSFSGSIPENLFKNCENLSKLNLAFHDAKNITGSIPENLFINNKELKSVNAIFCGCSGLTGSIPENLFKNTTKMVTFQEAFYGCTGLTGSIPENLFKNCNPSNLSEVFVNCSNITGNIPENLFSNCTEVTTFWSTFAGCSGLTGEIPAELFKSCTKVSTFNSAFRDCRNLSGPIPENLFYNNTEVKDYAILFCGCENLTGSIPEELFSSSPNASSFGYTFYNCKKITGNAPELWNRDNVTNSRYCFTGCTNLSNYNEIPDSWK